MMRRTGKAPVKASSFAPFMMLMLILFWLPGAAFCQEVDSTQVILADSTVVTLPDSTAGVEAADSTAVALPDSAAGAVLEADSTGVTVSDSTGMAPPDSSGIATGAPMRFYDPRPGARLSPFSGKSVKREHEDLLAFATTTPGEAFAFEPGVDLLVHGSAGLPQALRLRASRPKDVMYLIDGIPVSDDRLEIFDLNWLPLSGMEKAEVAMNGQSGLYGSGATGGVMNLTSMSAMPQVPTSEVVAWWGSFDSRAINFRFNRRITSRFGILLSFENLHSGGWTESSEANSNKFFGKLTGFLGRGVTYDVVGYRYDAAIELPNSCPGVAGTYPADRDDKRDFVRVSVAGGTDTSVRLDYYYLGTERDFSSGDATEESEGRLHGFSVTTTRLAADSSIAAFGAGLKRYRLRFDLQSMHPDEESTNDIYGYIAGDKRLNAWRLRGSVRVDVSSGNATATELSGDLGASFKAAPWCILFGRADRSFAFPSLRECTGWSGCPRDTAEHWNGLELGADLGPDPVRLVATFFWRSADRRKGQVRDENCDRVFSYNEEVSYLGAEALLSFTYPHWLRGSLGYSLERARDGSGNKVSYVPSGTFTWDLRANTRFSGHVSAGLTFAGRWVPPVWVGDQPIPCSEGGCAYDADLDGYVSGLIYGYIDIDSGRVYARVRNLFNQGITQIWGHPELPPRSYEFGVNLELFD